MRHFRPSVLARLAFPDALFRFATDKKEICLTFDDGPDPATTTSILRVLEDHGARAVFFCTGSAAETHPGLVRQIEASGHLTGNHGYSHLRGWETPLRPYIDNFKRAASFTSSLIFRPPYGSLSPGQYRELRKLCTVVLWDLMTYDFDLKFGASRTLDTLKRKIRPGSVIVFHDKVDSVVLEVLDAFMRFAKTEGYSFVVPDMIRQGKGKLR